MPSVSEVAYAAGFFDGEGHISIAKRTARSRKKYGTYTYERYDLIVTTSQVFSGPIIWLQERFGGRIRRSIAKRSYDRGLYARWDWILSSQNGATFLRAVLPYLIVKRREAEIALDFVSTLSLVRPGSKKLPAWIQEKRAKLYGEIREARRAIKIA